MQQYHREKRKEAGLLRAKSISQQMSFSPYSLSAVATGSSSNLVQRKKKPTKDIRKDYQVKDDKMIDWSPSAFGVSVPFTGSRRMTETEGELLDGMLWQKGLVEMFTFKEIHDKAFAESTSRYPNPGSIPAYVPKARRREWLQNDGHRDAFRHCYWNVLLAKRYGQKWSREFATAHEGAPGNPAEREAMDLWNNEVGRKIAKDNPRLSEKKLADKVQEAVKNGDLVVINQSHDLAYSDKVKLWEHGFTGAATANGKIKADGDVSAKSG